MRTHDRAFLGALFIIAGVAVGVLFADGIAATLAALLIAACAWFFIWSIKSASRASFFILPLLLFGVWHAQTSRESYRPNRASVDTEFSGRVITLPIERARQKEFDVELLPPQSGRVRIYHNAYPDVSYGDSIAFQGSLKISRYGRVYASNPKIQSIISNEDVFFARLFSAKEKILSVFQRTLSSEHAALLSGILLGERSGFSPQFNEAMRRSGTTHIVALSGYNISVIVVLLSAIFFVILPPVLAVPAILVAMLSFIIMTGSEESVVRAGIMGSIALIAHRAGKRYSMRNAIAFAALAMLLWNPFALLSVGFQLSFAALLGIVYLKPLIERALRIHHKSSFLNWKENLIMTISAQLAVMPIIIWTFRSIPLTAIAANVLILETIPFSMIAGAGLGIVGVVSQSAAIPLAWIAHIFLSYQIAIINLFSRLAIMIEI